MSAARRPTPPRTLTLAIALLALLATAGIAGAQQAPPGLDAPPDPVDPQSWERPQDMTWDDYTPIPGWDWTSDDHQPPRKIRAALILGDFQDRDFVVTLPEGSDEAGNPRGVSDIPREEVAEYYRGFLNEPTDANHHHTINEYWLEDSYGLIGVEMDAFGPYRMEGKEHEYGLADAGGAGDSCPEGDDCGKNFDTELLEASTADVTAATAQSGEDYDFRYLLHAGYDESGTWQEFGEMMFETPEDVTDEFGNPDESKPNHASTRYVDWTSFWAAKGIWSHALPGALSTQGESDGQSTFAHELSHILGVLDNYNNPYGEPVQRSYTGPWAQLSRGTFNGPGGPHSRWLIPADQGGALGSHHMLRNKLRLGFLKPGEVLFLDRETLAASGPQFADVWSRAVPVGVGTGREGLHGLQIRLTGGDQSPDCSVEEDWRCDGGGDYTAYTLEVVDRMGTDSFTPDHGVLIAKTKDVDTPPFMWAVDAHPEDIDLVDFVRPDGTEAKVSLGDYRQLLDALFHAGTGPGVVHEYVDEANRLHFYVLEKRRDEEGVLQYRVAVRSLDGGGPFGRGVESELASTTDATPGRVAVCEYDVTNTGDAADLVRLAADTPDGWEPTLRYEVVEIGSGETSTVPVYVEVPQGAADRSATVTLTATSETDETATTETDCGLTAAGAPVGGPGEDPAGAPDAGVEGATALPTTGGGAAGLAVAVLLVAGLVRRRIAANRTASM